MLISGDRLAKPREKLISIEIKESHRVKDPGSLIYVRICKNCELRGIMAIHRLHEHCKIISNGREENVKSLQCAQ